ncbi:peptide deformylase [Bacillus spizizenii]|uniref:Peptide deformylase n=1 Tax=Bacillus spizizenii TaxID=96241 RepID=A0A9Q4DL54_BACSC|nr:peptide deformylase [Bacillus spizizenii]MDU7577677.1 peptide deformylase [Bacillus subtilis]MCY7796114.1 peptide deformylase [Bacillus spizizenii]MCY7804245.1 peptide deformylase [Bacillus spizizenii]MCY7809543.1 peptide deformylase [Bacillus spizizenii]MCY7811796.1 peptide deformylase [Bacillus spizizenii]
MAVKKVVTHPAEVLETPTESVTVFDKKLKKLLDDMYDTMLEMDGVGLAAPQIGILKRVAVVDIGDNSGRIDLVNPEILEKSGEQTGIEGCLSFPGVYGDVTRADYVKVRAFNRQGKSFILEARGFLARAVQHEMDHLDGVLFTSKISKYYTEDELADMEG